LLLQYLKVRWFTEAEQEDLESERVRLRFRPDEIGEMIASVSFCPTGGKMILGPKKDEVRIIDCEAVDDYSDWDTFCLVKVQDPPWDPRLLVVRHDDLEKPPVN
jgi:hypothetical protein